MKWIFRFFVYSNLFIAVCAVLMVNQTYRLILHSPPNLNFLFFVFFSTICSYSFHWFLASNVITTGPRIEWAKRYHALHLVLLFTSLVVSIVFFFYLLPYWHWLLLSAIVTFLYSAPMIPNKYFRALRKVALGKTIFLAFVWMFVSTILPFHISQQPWHNDFILFIISRFFLIYSICILFDYRDREDDKAAGIHSLVTYLNEKSIFYVFVASLLIFAIATLWMLQYGYTPVEISILLLPGIITGGLYNYAKRKSADIFYYFVLDGLMALSAILMLITGI
ncbi:MAG: UbiA family prenyltransferase [Bacteroidia bacterium]|nr:UbiA family prenyltransferase [Bacteroidia bacterium]